MNGEILAIIDDWGEASFNIIYNHLAERYDEDDIRNCIDVMLRDGIIYKADITPRGSAYYGITGEGNE
jgi:hypothetical protein